MQWSSRGFCFVWFWFVFFKLKLSFECKWSFIVSALSWKNCTWFVVVVEHVLASVSHSISYICSCGDTSLKAFLFLNKADAAIRGRYFAKAMRRFLSPVNQHNPIQASLVNDAVESPILSSLKSPGPGLTEQMRLLSAIKKKQPSLNF